MDELLKRDKLLKPAEAAEVIGLTETRIYQLINEGVLDAEQFPHGKKTKLRIRESVALAFEESRRIPESLPSREAQAA